MADEETEIPVHKEELAGEQVDQPEQTEDVPQNEQEHTDEVQEAVTTNDHPTEETQDGEAVGDNQTESGEQEQGGDQEGQVEQWQAEESQIEEGQVEDEQVEGQAEQGLVEEGQVEDEQVEAQPEEAQVEEGQAEDGQVEGQAEEGQLEEGKAEEGQVGEGGQAEEVEDEGQTEEAQNDETNADETQADEGDQIEEDQTDENQNNINGVDDAEQAQAEEATQEEPDTQRTGDEDQPGLDGPSLTETKAQQTTPNTTSAQSPGAPTPGGQERGEDEEELQLVDKKTPEPATEDMASGTEPAREDMETSTEPTQQMEAPVDPHAPSPEPQYDRDATATVKFVLLPTQQVATLRCHLTQTLYELKQHFAQELKIPAHSILLMLDGKGTGDQITLGDLGVGPNGTIRLEMQSADPDNQPIRAFKPQQEYTMPDVISVRVNTEGVIQDIVIEIERSNKKKPFLGGYRHKKTGIEFHHASAQTVQKPRPPPAVERYCRDTQTVKQKNMVQQTTNDMSTQMTKIGVYVSNMPDKLMIPGKYTSADDFRANKLNQVVIIQKYYRRWLAKRYVEKVRDDKADREEWERQEEIRKKKEKEDRIRREFERRMNPKTKEDFDLLYHALEKWRQEEMNHINESLTGAERKAALCQLLDQETQLIASIGRHKLEADDEGQQKRVQSFLDKAAAPKKWRGRDGKATEMDTPFTIRAQELRDIYNSINMKYLTQDERLDVLLTLKHTVKEHDCKLTGEIIELIDREADLLMRGVKESNLEGLRKRISTLFLQYIKTPTFNPEAARLLKVPQDPSTLRKNIYFCPSCTQYLPSTEFGLSSNSRAVGKCRSCSKTDNDARVRQDYSHYRYMLKSVRRQEEAYADGSKIAYLLQENDLRYLVENVWNGQSVLSAWDDLYDLVLVRWDKHEEWSPWNSILLTKEEATAHERLVDLEEAYGKVFVHKIKHRHTLSRNYFSRMPGMAEHMRSRHNSAAPNGPAVSGKAVPIASH